MYSLLINFNFLRQSAKLTICAGVLLSIGACQSPSQTAEVSADNPIPVSNPAFNPVSGVEQIPATVADAQLSAELLYDILVATIAAQRNNVQLALESLSRAAYRSGDNRLITEAIQFSLNMQAYQHAHELAQFFNRLEPDNPTASLFLAKTQFKLGDSHSALLLLTNLVRNKTDDNVSLLQNIAILLVQQNQKTILSEFTKYLEKTPANDNSSAQLTLTAALLASELQNSDEYIRLLDDTLQLKPGWEAPGILKLIALSDYNSDYDIGRINRFVTTYLNRYPQHNLFRLQYARLLIRQNEIDSALAHLEEILQSKPAEIQHNADVQVAYLGNDVGDYTLLGANAKD